MSDQHQQPQDKRGRKIDLLDMIDSTCFGDRVELGPEPDESGYDPEAYDSSGSVADIRVGLANCPTAEECQEGGL